MAELILGLDPGSRVTGFAVLEEQAGIMKAVRCDVIRLAHLDDHADRLQLLFEKVAHIIDSIEPIACAVETPVYGKDPMAMLKLGRAQAACFLAITNAGFPVTEYYPKEIKKSITGNGNASKEQVAFMLNKMVRIEDNNVPRDATDALAVAWCHMLKKGGVGMNRKQKNKTNHKNRRKSGWKSFIENNPDRVQS